MMTVVSLLPLVATIVLLASGRASALQAGLVGAALMAVAAALALPAGTDAAAFLLHSAAEGAWLAAQIVFVIAGGLFFFLCAQKTDGREAAQDKLHPALAYRRLFAACLILGPFAESAMGFGVGVIVATAAALRLGVRGIDAVVLALFSQALVPWGALAIGTMLGSALSGFPPELLGWWSAVLSVPLLAGYLVFFWRFAAHAGFRIDAEHRVADALWLAAGAGLLVLANRILATEIALLAAFGGLFVAHMVVHDRPQDWRDLVRRSGPYVALTVVLIATRTVPPLTASLSTYAAVKPFTGQPALAPFYNPGFWLFAIGFLTLVVHTQAAKASIILHEMAMRAWRPAAAITLVFVVMAQWMSASGIAASLAAQAYGAFGSVALAASPVLAALGGFFTGSNAVSNGMMMPIQAELGRHADLPEGFLAGVQNTTGSNFTLLSPMRVAMGCALAGAVTDRAVYARAWPLGAFVLLVMVLAIAMTL